MTNDSTFRLPALKVQGYPIHKVSTDCDKVNQLDSSTVDSGKAELGFIYDKSILVCS